MSGLRITTDRAAIDLDRLHAFLSERSYWAKGIPRAVMEKSLAHSLCFIALKDGEMVGFARLITDRATFAFLSDVYVEEAHRGQGISKQLMEAILQHTDLQGLRRIMLRTHDAHGLYEQFGFTVAAKPEQCMEIRNPNLYQTSPQP